MKNNNHNLEEEIELQRLVLPSYEFGAPAEMYFRTDAGAAVYRFQENLFRIPFGKYVSFESYYNGLTVHKWKNHTKIDNLSLNIAGKGRCLVRLGLRISAEKTQWLQESSLELDGGTKRVNIDSWSEIKYGILFFIVISLDHELIIYSSKFNTNTPPTSQVKLGIVVTHYNRKSFVVPAMKRIMSEIVSTPNFRSKIELVVVDNSQNIALEESQGATVIPSNNLGGSGGFMRGLLHLEDRGDFTHCLFMDDDASCEIESIRRAYRLLQFISCDRTAISGALLRELEPNRMFEKGAIFDGVGRPLNAGLDMCSAADVLACEREDAKPNYGAWWFFAFALADVKSYAFPFFVRGDDILFSLMNNFSIFTMNGISCWGEDFSLKNGPLPIYLDMRSTLVINMHVNNHGRLSLLKRVIRMFFQNVNAYLYGSAHSISLALEHVMLGERFWNDNLDLKTVRETVLKNTDAWNADGSQVPAKIVQPKLRRKFISQVLRISTLNGVLLPDMLFRSSAVIQPKGSPGLKSQIFRHRVIYYEYNPLKTGFFAHLDRKKYVQETTKFVGIAVKFFINHRLFILNYRTSITEMTSRDFWCRAYNQPIENNDLKP